MTFIPVSDPRDPRLTTYTNMTDEALRRRRESADGDLAGLFICEGTKVTRRALDAGLVPHSVLIGDDMLDRLPALPESTPVYVASPDVVEIVIGFRFHRGFVAAFHRPPPADPQEVLRSSRRAIVCENVTNPTNLGVMIRSAAALGFDCLLLDPTSCDPLYRRSVRVSMGTVFSLPFARISHFPGGIETLRKAGFRTIGLSPRPGSSRLSQIEIGERTALVMGAEGPGLTAATEDALDHLAHIPMSPGIDSLNVASAAAIATYVVGGLDR